MPKEHGWCFISDKKKGLREALKDLVLEAEHRLCVRHIYANFCKQFKGQELKDAMWACARASTRGQLIEKMKALKDLDGVAHSYMERFEYGLWDKHASRNFSKCDCLCSNISECFNAYIRDARDQPIITCLETMRLLLMKRFQEKHLETIRLLLMKRIQEKHSGTVNYPNEIMPRVLSKLVDNKKKALPYIVNWNGTDSFQVARCGRDGHMVSLDRFSCSCNMWSLTGIPCVHACAAAFHIKRNPDDYIHHV
ncbi:unnamed protein product [Rhodiola kirilowii]